MLAGPVRVMNTCNEKLQHVWSNKRNPLEETPALQIVVSMSDFLPSHKIDVHGT